MVHGSLSQTDDSVQKGSGAYALYEYFRWTALRATAMWGAPWFRCTSSFVQILQLKVYHQVEHEPGRLALSKSRATGRKRVRQAGI